MLVQPQLLRPQGEVAVTGFASVVSRALAALGGPLTAGLVVVVGIVVGTAGVVVTRPQSPVGASAGSVAVYPCPRQGPPIAMLQPGQQLLVTGRLADGSWLRIHLPAPGRTEGWVEGAPLTVDGSVDALPVVACSPEAGAPSPAIAPAESFTAIVNATPSPGIPQPTPSPTPSLAPTPSPTANVGPALTGLATSARTISYDQGAYCPSAVKAATISVTAADPTGVASVTLYWRKPGSSTYTLTAMAMASGSATSGVWRATLSTASAGITTAGSLAYYVVAADAAGAKTRAPSSGSNTLTVAVCANTGPTISSVASSSGSNLYWDPLGVGTCQTATNITASVADQDTVSSVTLYFRRPGSSTWSSKAMDNTTLPPKWYANLDTLGDQITIPSPPTGTVSWYIKAVDGKNKASQSKTFSTTIRRCDSPAVIYVNSLTTSYTYCPQPPSNTTSVALRWSFSIADPDTLTSATLTYQITNNATGQTQTQTLTTSVSGQRFSITSGPIDGATFYGSNLVTWTITTTDLYGGHTSRDNKATVMILIC